MDNKKLMQILIRDIRELEELIAEMKTTQRFDQMDFELLHTRTVGVRHLMELTIERSKPEVNTMVVHEPVPVAKAGAVEIEPVGKAFADAQPLRYVTEPPIPEKEMPAPVAAPKVEVSIPAPEVPSKPVIENVAEKTSPAAVVAAEDEELDLEEADVVPGEKQTLGESFTKSRSVNDLLLEQGKNDYKYSHIPLTSLQAAIGINDRFLFARELFDGNNQAFAQALHKLDSLSSLHDAASYLRENFKWKKSETSLKFIELVKRRFIR